VAARRTLREVFESLPGGVAATSPTQLLTDNMDSWNARWHLLDNAKQTVDTTYFILNNDVYGYAYLGHLLKKAREGLKVRVMVDATGTPKFKATMMGQDYLQELVASGIETRVYHPLWKKLPKGGVMFWTAAASPATTTRSCRLTAVTRSPAAATSRRTISPIRQTCRAVFRDTDQRIWDPAATRALDAAFAREWNAPGRTISNLNHTIVPTCSATGAGATSSSSAPTR